MAGVAVHAAIDGHAGLVEGDFRIKTGDVPARHVGRIGDDEVESRAKGGEPVSTHDPGAIANPMSAHVAGRHGTSPLTDVESKARAAGPRHEERDQKTSRSGSKIKNTCRGMAPQAVKTAFDQCFAVRTRSQGVRGDLEVEAPELAKPGNLREGLTLRPPVDEGGESALLPARKRLRFVTSGSKPCQKPGFPGRVFDTGGAQLRCRSPQGIMKPGRRHVSEALPGALPGRWTSAVR